MRFVEGDSPAAGPPPQTHLARSRRLQVPVRELRSMCRAWCALTVVFSVAFVVAGCGATAPSRPAGEGPAADASGDPEALSGEIPEAARRSYEGALAAMQRDDYTEAELELEQLMLAYPDLPGPYVNAAIVYRRDGREEDALAVLERALAIAPGHAEANNQLGIVLRERGDFAGAEQAYRRALAQRPDYALALYNLGVLLDLYLQRQPEALAYYEQYQNALAEPDERVARWIIDLRRRVGANDNTARVAQGENR